MLSSAGDVSVLDSGGRSSGRPPESPQGALLLIVVNVGWFFLSHRLPIAVAAKKAGYRVHVACGIDDASEETAIRAHGLQFHRLALSRRGKSPITEFQVFLQLLVLYRRLKPDIVHQVSIKPVIYGGLVSRLVPVGKIVSAISGLGYVFTASGCWAGIARATVRFAYRIALTGRRTQVVFQNQDDLGVFVKSGMVRESDAVLIRGSGVDLGVFTPTPLPADQESVTVVLPARMLRDKGVFEFLEASSMLRSRGSSARFVLAGGLDPDNPAAISETTLLKAVATAGVEWLGHCPDMPRLLASSQIVCLPSYREGLPKVLLEAAASGRPMVATDVPGCREIVLNGDTGFLVPPRDAGALADALEKLIRDAPLRARMGARAREICQSQFGVEVVVRKTLALYER